MAVSFRHGLGSAADKLLKDLLRKYFPHNSEAGMSKAIRHQITLLNLDLGRYQRTSESVQQCMLVERTVASLPEIDQILRLRIG